MSSLTAHTSSPTASPCLHSAPGALDPQIPGYRARALLVLQWELPDHPWPSRTGFVPQSCGANHLRSGRVPEARDPKFLPLGRSHGVPGLAPTRGSRREPLPVSGCCLCFLPCVCITPVCKVSLLNSLSSHRLLLCVAGMFVNLSMLKKMFLKTYVRNSKSLFHSLFE